MKTLKLSREEEAIERSIAKGEYQPVSPAEFQRIAKIIAHRRKEAILSLRINKAVLESLKRKAKKLGVPYQTFISEILHRYAT